jgi:hypothetical protein
MMLGSAIGVSVLIDPLPRCGRPREMPLRLSDIEMTLRQMKDGT